MKILVVVILAVAAGVYCNVEQEADISNLGEQHPNKIGESSQVARQFHSWGTGGGPDDRIISSSIHRANAFQFLPNEQEVTYRAHKYTNITLITVRALDWTQSGVELVDGGLYQNFVTLRFKGQRSASIANQIDIYATINCFNN